MGLPADSGSKALPNNYFTGVARNLPQPSLQIAARLCCAQPRHPEEVQHNRYACCLAAMMSCSVKRQRTKRVTA